MVTVDDRADVLRLPIVDFKTSVKLIERVMSECECKVRIALTLDAIRDRHKPQSHALINVNVF